MNFVDPKKDVSRKHGNTMVVIATSHKFGVLLISGCQEVEGPPFVDRNVDKRICIPVVSYLRRRKRRGDRAVEGARLENVGCAFSNFLWFDLS